MVTLTQHFQNPPIMVQPHGRQPYYVVVNGNTGLMIKVSLSYGSTQTFSNIQS